MDLYGDRSLKQMWASKMLIEMSLLQNVSHTVDLEAPFISDTY